MHASHVHVLLSADLCSVISLSRLMQASILLAMWQARVEAMLTLHHATGTLQPGLNTCSVMQREWLSQS
jgi:hypothetical protein